METHTLLHNLGAASSLALGLVGALRPRLAAKITSLEPVGALGLSEIRATYGGLFTALGGLAIVSQESGAFLVAGIAWAGIAAGRRASVFVDESRSPRNLGALAVEAVVAGLFLFPS